MDAKTLDTDRNAARRATPAAGTARASAIHASILTTIGNTPVVRINKLAPPGVNLFVKLEAFNPLGSVKDRLALGVIEAAERDGSLKPGQTVIEATSGNTGIGLAMVCAQKGYPLVVTMAENFSVERRRMMRFLGARVVLTPASEKGSGMLNKALELAKKHGWFLCRQFTNEANADIHSATTAQEILADFPDGKLDYFVSGFGTGGTLKGVARVLRERSPRTRIVATEPDNAPMLASGVVQPSDEAGDPQASHPAFRPHLMQGWSPDFISKLAKDVLDGKLVDEIIGINGAEALRLARALARQEGIFCGISSGATFAGALEVCRRAAPGANVLCMLPDTGERYLSTPLFEDIGADMSEEEIAISESTPRYRFGAPSGAPAPAPAAQATAKPPTPAAVEFVESALASREQPVVMFALEWCEFCWSVRKLFKALEIPYRAIDLDSVEYQRDNFGGEIRAALGERLKVPTIPQVFVGGEHLGGCTDTFDAFKQGRLQALLQAHGVAYRGDEALDPYSLLPRWLHPR
jgi:cysteine synthase